MANELASFKIIGAGSSGSDLVLHPSDFTCYNELSYLTSPSRDNQFELNSEDIVSKYIPKINLTIPVMSEEEYKMLIAKINTTSFSVEYYDIEILQIVSRTFYCSSKSYDSLEHLSDSKNLVKGVKVEFVSIFGYNDYAELKSATKTRETTNSVITARIYFANPTGATINTINATGGYSPISTFQGGSYSQSKIGKVSLGSHIYLFGTPFDSSIFGNTYYGMILSGAKSSETISAENDYEIVSPQTITINVSSAGTIFVRFDYIKTLYATRYTLNGVSATNDNELIELSLAAGDNTFVINALNKPQEYVRISTITPSLVIDYKTTDYLTGVSLDISATNEIGKAQYGFTLPTATIEVYDKSDIIKELAEDNMISNATQVELYMNLKGVDLTDSDRIAIMSVNSYDYTDSSYNKKFTIKLKDAFEDTNSIMITDSEELDKITGNGIDVYNFMVDMLYRNNFQISGTFTVYQIVWTNITHTYLLDTKYSLFNMISYFAKSTLCYAYSNGNGYIKMLGGE